VPPPSAPLRGAGQSITKPDAHSDAAHSRHDPKPAKRPSPGCSFLCQRRPGTQQGTWHAPPPYQPPHPPLEKPRLVGMQALGLQYWRLPSPLVLEIGGGSVLLQPPPTTLGARCLPPPFAVPSVGRLAAASHGSDRHGALRQSGAPLHPLDLPLPQAQRLLPPAVARMPAPPAQTSPPLGVCDLLRQRCAVV